MVTFTLAHLLKRDVRLQRYEALAIAQELIARGEGVPTVDNVQLSSDGSVTCINTNGTPQVSDFAALLQTLLPTAPAQVPAPLRYTLARGLGEVEAPPFESLDAFSQSLARFAAGEHRGIIRALLQRAAAVQSQPPRPSAAAAAPAVVAATWPAVAAPAAVATPPPAAAAPVAAAVAVVPAVIATPPPAAAAPVAAVEIPLPSVSAATRPAILTRPAPAQPAVFPVSAGSPPPRVRSASGPVNWAAAVAAIAASFVIGAFGAQRAGVWMSRATKSEARPQTSPAPATRTAADTRARARDAERPVSTSGSAPAAPQADVSPAAPNSAAPEVGPAAEPDRVIGGASESAFSPAFSNDGSEMFFHTGGAGDASSAIAMTPSAHWSAGELRIVKVLDDGARNYHPRPSPDGRLIAFDSDRDGERGVYVANGDGTEVRRISGDGYAAAPTWSPDGKRLAYIRAEPGNARVWNLWVQPVGAPRATRVTAHQYGQTWSASWFPDSTRICYTHEDKVIVRDLSTGNSRQFASPVAGRPVRTPAVSPDGTQVVFQVSRNGGWLLDLASGSMRHVLSDPSAEEFAWAPDGNRIAFHSRRTGEWSIYVMAPN